MSSSTLNFTSPEASTNSTDQSFNLIERLEIFAFSIHFVFGMPIHFYIIWLIVTERRSGVASEFFNLNLSVCEIGNGLNAIFAILSVFFSSFTMISHFFQGLGITGRPLFQCLMCVERYLAVVHPVTFLKYKPLRYRLICCAVAWTIITGSCLFCMLILLSLSIVPYMWFFSTQFLLFLFIQLCCLVAVLRALKQSGPGERKKEEESQLKKKAFYTILITTVNLIVQYFPFAITGFFAILTRKPFYSIWIPAFLCYVLTGFVPPILYLHRAGKLYFFC